MSGRNSKYFCKKATRRARPPMTKFGCHDGVLHLARATGQLQRRQPCQRTRRDPLRSPGCTRAPDSGCIASYLRKTDCAARTSRDLRVGFRVLARSLGHLQRCSRLRLALLDVLNLTVCAREPDSASNVRNLEISIVLCEPVETCVSIFGS